MLVITVCDGPLAPLLKVSRNLLHGVKIIFYKFIRELQLSFTSSKRFFFLIRGCLQQFYETDMKIVRIEFLCKKLEVCMFNIYCLVTEYYLKQPVPRLILAGDDFQIFFMQTIAELPKGFCAICEHEVGPARFCF